MRLPTFVSGRAAALAVALAVVLPAPAVADLGALGPQQLTLVREERLSPRLLQLTFRTPAVAGETGVRVLLPAGYDSEPPTARHPMLFLLHGALDDHTAWTLKGEAEAITKDADMIVVMPASGTGGGYVDWFNGGAFGPPAWETYHLGQLLPWIDGHFRTRGTRGGRALAGLSMGGYGTMHYAARHPDLFAAATAFSPAVDLDNPPLVVVNSASDLGDGDASPYGPYAAETIRWRGHNPTELAENLAGITLVLRTGNGLPGGPGGDTGDPVEAEVHEEATNMHRELERLKIPHVWDDYGAGGHTWFYWQRSLRQTLPLLAKTFADPPAPPRRVTYRSIDPSFSVYGWRVVLRRPALEFAELRDADRDGFVLRGSGRATVRTARVAPSRARVVARVTSAAGVTSVRRVRADTRGRVRLALDLGPGNEAQQDTAEARLAGGTVVREVRVALRATPAGRAKPKRPARR